MCNRVYQNFKKFSKFHCLLTYFVPAFFIFIAFSSLGHHFEKNAFLHSKNEAKICKIENLLISHPKVVNVWNKCLIHHFGEVLAWKKWSPFLDSGARSPIFGHLKVGTFPIFRCPKMGLWAAESKNGDHFFTPTSPQNGGIDICFMRLPLLGELLANFDKSPFFSRFPL